MFLFGNIDNIATGISPNISPPIRVKVATKVRTKKPFMDFNCFLEKINNAIDATNSTEKTLINKINPSITPRYFFAESIISNLKAT